MKIKNTHNKAHQLTAKSGASLAFGQLSLIVMFKKK